MRAGRKRFVNRGTCEENQFAQIIVTSAKVTPNGGLGISIVVRPVMGRAAFIEI